jgi:hypothetical protein
LARWEEQHKSNQNKKKRQRRFQEAEEKLREIKKGSTSEVKKSRSPSARRNPVESEATPP